MQLIILEVCNLQAKRWGFTKKNWIDERKNMHPIDMHLLLGAFLSIFSEEFILLCVCVRWVPMEFFFK